MFHILVALHAEAKPLIDFFGLKKVDSLFYPQFKSEQIHLTISGVGSMNASACLMHLYHSSKSAKNAFWINIGLAGSKADFVEKLFIASKISHPFVRKKFYPYFPKKVLIEKREVISLDAPSKNYDESSLFDMEAYGFFSTALKFSTLEKIQVLKIISDNEAHSLSAISKEFCSYLIQKNIDAIASFLKALKKIHLFKKEPINLDPYLDSFHFSKTQKYQLEKSLKTLLQFQSLELLQIDLNQYKSGTELIKVLEKKISMIPLGL